MHQSIKRLIAGAILTACVPFNVLADNTNDFASRSNFTRESFESALYYELEPLSDVFLECEEATGVNAACLAGIAALESGWGTSDLASEKNNLFGWRSNDGDYMWFASKETCIRYVAKSIAENYLDESGKYYSGGTNVEQIAKYYSESSEWAEQLNDIIDDIEERAENYDLGKEERTCPY